MSRRVVVSLVVLCALGLHGCGKADLSRGKAEALISQSSDFQSLRKALVFHREAYQKGIQQGMWKDEFQRGWHVGIVTDKGKRYFSEIAQVPMSNNRAGAPVAEVKVPSVKVTGIAKEGDTQRIADFSWSYVDLPPVVKRFVVAGGLGKAQFKLFDDGWRLEHLELSVSDQPVTLSEREKAEEQADLEAAAKEAQTAAEKRRLQAEAKARRIEESQKPTRQVGSFSNFATAADFTPKSKPGPGTVIVTDVNIDFTSRGTHCTAWFGWVKEITKDAGHDSAYQGLFAHIEANRSAWMGQGGLGCGNIDSQLSFPSAEERDRFMNVANAALKAWRAKYPDL